LSNNFGILVDYGFSLDRDRIPHFVSLIYLDVYNAKWTKLQTVEYQCERLRIMVNKIDPAEFVIRLEINGEYSVRICKVIGKEFVVGNPIDIPFAYESYCDGRFYLIWSDSMVC
jgi:hypothetical protein